MTAATARVDALKELAQGLRHADPSQVHEQAGRHEAALQAFQAFHSCQQRISGQESQRRIRGLLGRAELERAHRDTEHQRQRGDALPLDDLHPDLKSVAISVGLAGAAADPAGHGLVDAELGAQADRQLYRAKAEGRDRVCW